MTDRYDKLEQLNRLLGAAEDHFAKGSAIWNRYGLDSPQFAKDAAQSALLEYQKSVELLEPSHFKSLSNEAQDRIAANRELAAAHAASAKTVLSDESDDDALEEIIELIQREIDHTERAIEYLELSTFDEPETLFSWRANVRHSQGRKANLLGRLASRRGKLSEARVLYQQAQENFGELMIMYEAQTPALASIREDPREVTSRSTRSVEGEKAKGIRFTALLLHASKESPPLPNEDLYRRAASNYYSSSALRAHLEAFEILNNGGSVRDADSKLKDSIDYVYSAMRIFPENLGFHEDLFNTWRARGELFGCPIEESEEYYHIRCPLAIMHYVGHWYVSPTIEYDAMVCTVCGLDILECPHYPGQVVNDKMVSYQPQNPRFTSGSLVEVPEDPRCRIEWISVPKDAFPSLSEGESGLRCHLCQMERDKGEVEVRLVELPEWIEDEARKRYRQIKRSKRFRTIEVRIPEKSSE